MTGEFTSTGRRVGESVGIGNSDGKGEEGENEGKGVVSNEIVGFDVALSETEGVQVGAELKAP